MCLITPTKKPYVAEEDIYCYKVLTETSRGLLTPFQDFPIELGKVYESPKIEEEIEDNEINGGFFHALTSPNGQYLNGFGSNCGIYLAVIPKGSQFFLNNGGTQICATSIKIIKKVLSYLEVPTAKESSPLQHSTNETFCRYSDSLTTIDSIVQYAEEHGLYSDLLNKYKFFDEGSYEKNLYAYRLIVAVLTENEENRLTQGDCYYPYVDFYNGTNWTPYNDLTKIGTVVSEGTSYLVVGGNAHSGSNAGLGYFYSGIGVSYSFATVGFRSVSSREIAKFISRHFGKIVFDLMYGLSNCDYYWAEEKE